MNYNDDSFSRKYKVSYCRYYLGKFIYILKIITSTSCKRNLYYKTYEQTTLLLKKMNNKLDIRNVCSSIFLNNSTNNERSSNSKNNNKIKINKEEQQHKESINKLIMNPNIDAFRNIIREEL